MSTQASDTTTRHSTVVEAPIDRAFSVFTDGFGSFKPREHNMLAVDIAETVFEPHVGGNIYDRGVDGSECRWARVLAYEPPDRVVFSWDNQPAVADRDRSGEDQRGRSALHRRDAGPYPRRARAPQPRPPRRRLGRRTRGRARRPGLAALPGAVHRAACDLIGPWWRRRPDAYIPPPSKLRARGSTGRPRARAGPPASSGRAARGARPTTPSEEEPHASHRVPSEWRPGPRVPRGAGRQTRAGVVVLQEWWGLDDHIRSVCDRLADEGFFALAPDLYRGETTTQPSEAEQRMMALSMAQTEKDMRGAAQYLTRLEGVRGDGVAALGFCLGGGLAVWAAASTPAISATVSYYYVMPHGKPDFSHIGGPVLGHFGTADEFVPVDAAKQLEAELRDAGVDVAFEYHDGAGHAFFNDTNRLGTHDSEIAERSWQRTLSFLCSKLSEAA